MSILLVNDQVHALLAMRALGAVHPDGSGVVDLDGIRGGLSGALGNELEAREEALHGGVVVGDGLARLVEGRLRDGVVSGGELELHHVSYGGGHFVGEVLELAAGGADADDMDGGLC